MKDRVVPQKVREEMISEGVCVSDTVECEAKPLCLARRRLLVTQQSAHVGAKHSFIHSTKGY